MGKAEPMTAKAVSNRIKAKGLNKLRWYCQPCEKSCRDENGYKCHINTESHHRAMLLFAENASTMLTDYSRQFKDEFIDILRKRYGTRAVSANHVYNEYIANRHHIHMNATCWSSLSAFVKYLGREGEIRAEENERGWMITYIDRSPETLKRMERDAMREREVRDHDLFELELLNKQILLANQQLQESHKSFEASQPAPVSTSDTLQHTPSSSSKLSLGINLKKPSTISLPAKKKTPMKLNALLENSKSITPVVPSSCALLSKPVTVSALHAVIEADKNKQFRRTRPARNFK